MDDKLVSYIRRIEGLELQKKEISDDINSVYSELKGDGYDKKAVRQVLKLRKMLPADRAEYSYLVEEYIKQIEMGNENVSE